ncbi:T9SS type A sorting domain-containing protein [Flavobacterium sp.]|uniref:T9SS type A sorting domain-containing protein n=1 Tax=Flavobacterium sp. TaxID=239 RepID=UPI0035B22618
MKKLYTLFLITISCLSFGQGPFTATYDFASVTTTTGATDPTPVPVVSGLTLGSFNAVNTTTPPTNSAGAGRFAFANQPLGATNGDNTYTNYTGALDPTIYYQVTVTPNSGTTYNLTGITFRVQRSGTGVRNYAVRSSADSYASNLTASINPANTALEVVAGDIFFYNADATGGQNGSTITLSGPSFTNLTTPVTFRFYGYNAEAAGGNFSIDDVAISGNVTTLSSSSFDAIEGLTMYPNPLKGNTLFITSTANAEMNVKIYNVLGKEVLSTKVNNTSVDVSNLASGVYMVKITEEGKTATRKLVIQ